MRWLSVLLVFCLSYTFVHEALCHGGALDVLCKYFAHAGHVHAHHNHGHTNNAEPPQTEHESNHHDDEAHDHQLETLLVKKDPSSYRRSLLVQTDAAVHSMPGVVCLAGVSSLSSSSIPEADSSALGYVRAHILRL